MYKQNDKLLCITLEGWSYRQSSGLLTTNSWNSLQRIHICSTLSNFMLIMILRIMEEAPAIMTRGEGRFCKQRDTDDGLNVTYSWANIRYLQNVLFLNEAREKLETIIYHFYKSYGLPLPIRCKRHARKDYPAFAKNW